MYWSPWLLYLSFLILAFGACVGSFLNVIIYRWPRDISIRKPLWSFCPQCGATLRWWDNLPVVSYILLRGRCRYCRGSIALQYPLVELATAFSFLLVYDAFFVAHLRLGIRDLATDWPVLLAHFALVSGLIVLTVMDLEAYMVDIRVTWLMGGLGLLLYALWTPVSSTAPNGWIRPGASQAMVALAAALGLLLSELILLRRHAAKPLPISEDDPTDLAASPSPDADKASGDTPQEETATAPPPPHTRSLAWLWALFGTLVVMGYLTTMIVQEYRSVTRLFEPGRMVDGRLIWPAAPQVDPAIVRTLIGVAGLFVSLVLLASHPHPEEDEEIIESINAEAVDARRNAWGELKYLSPALLLMAGMVVLLLKADGLTGWIDRTLHTSAIGEWRPLLGLATALVGWVIGGAIAWLTRLLGTLCLGKEALGMGDVHIMAGVGALAGWCVGLVGFFLASFLALAGMIVIHLRRQSRAVPYGPWLALGAFVVVLYQDKLSKFLPILDLLR